MQYQSKKILQDFEFHDAHFKFERLESNTLTIAAQYLNIHNAAEQNPHPTDMEIELARITFHGFCTKSFEPGRAWKPDTNGKLYTDEPQVIFKGQTAEEKLLNELRAGVTVFEFGKLENGNYYFDGTGDEPWFQAQFLFDSAAIQWDTFKNPAWYAETKHCANATRKKFLELCKNKSISSDLVHFENSVADGYYVLKNGHRWEVFFRERGKDYECMGFPSENDALEYLLKKLEKA